MLLVTEHTYPACRFSNHVFDVDVVVVIIVIVIVVVVVVVVVVAVLIMNMTALMRRNDGDCRLAAEAVAERFGATIVTAPITLPVIIITFIIV